MPASNLNPQDQQPQPSKKGCMFMSDVPMAHRFLCLMYRRDFDQMSQENKEKYEIISQTFQSAVMRAIVKSTKEYSTIRIECLNVEVPTADKLLWTALHYLISADSTACVEIHNFGKEGSTIDVEKYVVANISMEIVRDYNRTGPQSIVIEGVINSEILE